MGRRDELLDLPGDLPVEGVDRRDFVKVCMMAAAALGLPAATGVKWAEAAEAGLKPSVIWLHFQECTGCTESLLRTTHPTLDQLILDVISLDYHETLFAAAGHQIEAALHDAVAAGGYVCVVEGAIPAATPRRSSRSVPAPRGAASRPRIPTRPALWALRRFSRTRPWSICPAVLRTPTTSSAWFSSS